MNFHLVIFFFFLLRIEHPCVSVWGFELIAAIRCAAFCIGKTVTDLVFLYCLRVRIFGESPTNLDIKKYNNEFGKVEEE